ncbi:hypothetical protein TNCT_688791 [Trichonephila clavata]|uniref:Uncharacterized protein n=1 Tax=Trichonephila clavata TaxID=2740835 RepID=A0A8X6GPZ9_TRICU|nr:hypothetical protein TNCT_688791 [Trichonephila clavata]
MRTRDDETTTHTWMGKNYSPPSCRVVGSYFFYVHVACRWNGNLGMLDGALISLERCNRCMSRMEAADCFQGMVSISWL